MSEAIEKFRDIVPADVFLERNKTDLVCSHLLLEAERHLAQHRFFRKILERYVGICETNISEDGDDSSPGIAVGVFLLRHETDRKHFDEYLWVIVGDLPPAYLVTEQANSPSEALALYTILIREWVDAVKSGNPVGKLIPVNIHPVPLFARQLEEKLLKIWKFLRTSHPAALTKEYTLPDEGH